MVRFAMAVGATLLLGGCGPDEGDTAAMPLTVVSAPAPVAPMVAATQSAVVSSAPGPGQTDPDPNQADLAAGQTALGLSSAAAQQLAPIPQYTYPDMASVSVADVTYPVGATAVHVPVSLDHATPNTVYAHVKTIAGSGTDYVGASYFKLVDIYVIFRPGDPLVKMVKVPVLKTKERGWFKLSIVETPQGGLAGKTSGRLTSITGAAPTLAIKDTSRAPRVFKPATLVYTMNTSTVKWSDKGGAGTFSTSYNHGRSQPANGETGLYLDNVLHPGAEPPIAVRSGKLVLHSQVLSKPISYNGVSYSYGAAVLNGRNMPESQITFGQYEWVVTLPDRRGAWPCLWLAGVRGWPPEIDVYEGFGQNASFDFTRHITANIHGGPINKRTFTRSMWIDGTLAFGLTNIARTTHRYAVDIQPDYITWFIDGIETYQARNPFAEPLYPLMSVAVKTSGAYSAGVGDMEISSFKVWKK